jgi:Thiolase-like protein type 1 additional C-terminal domain
LTRVNPAHTQAEVDALPRRDPASAYEGSATVEATAVVVERDGTPTLAIASTLTPDGRRALANTRDSDAMTDMTEKAWEGRTVKLRTDGTVNVLD